MKSVFKTCLVLFAAILFVGCAQKEGSDNKLQPPYSLKVSSDNVLTWSIVKGAAAYLPNINGEDCEEVVSNQLALSDVASGGHLVIKVKAKGDGVTWLDSEWSKELEYDMAVALETPLPIVSGKTVSWEAVEGASKYEYSINGSLVLTDATSIDLSGYLAERYTIYVRALPSDTKLNTASAWSSEVVVAIFDRLATPTLTVVQPSLKNPSAASVSWNEVEGASGYKVYVDDVQQECEGTSLDFTGKSGSFNVKVIAVNPGVYNSSEAAETTITINDYGKGTEAAPYKIYTAADWNDFSDLVTNNEGKAGYQDKFLELAADIDFENTYVKPAGKSAQMSFKGTLDGKDHILKNAKIGDGTASHQAFFYLLSGTVKNLKFDNITVTGGNATGAASSAAVITAGNSSAAFTIENCHVSNCNVTSGREGSYAAGLVARCEHSDVLIRNCSVKNCTITAGIANVGGVVGMINKGMIDNIQSSDNTITAGSRCCGGVVGGCGTAVMLLNVISEDNTCIAQSTMGGVVGNCTSHDESNTTKIMNVLSNGNLMKSLTGQAKMFVGGIVGGHENPKAYIATLANCIVLNGNIEYNYTGTESAPVVGCVGLIVGYSCVVWDNCIYNQVRRDKFDEVFTQYVQANYKEITGYDKNWSYRYAVGVKKNAIARASDAGTDKLNNVTCLYYNTSGLQTTAFTKLNDWVNLNKETYKTLKSWISDANNNNLPTLVLEETATSGVNSLNIVESNY